MVCGMIIRKLYMKASFTGKQKTFKRSLKAIYEMIDTVLFGKIYISKKKKVNVND